MGTLLSTVLYEVVGSGNEKHGRQLAFWCPGCKQPHIFAVERPNGSNAQWTYDGNAYKPSFHPSYHVTVGPWSDGDRIRPKYTICHLWVKNGQLQFLADSRHELAGQTVPMAPWPAGKSISGFE